MGLKTVEITYQYQIVGQRAGRDVCATHGGLRCGILSNTATDVKIQSIDHGSGL